MTRAEFIERNDCQKRNSDRVNKWLLGYLAVFALVLIWFGKYRDVLPKGMGQSIAMLTLFAGLFGILIFFGRRAQRQRRKLGLFCPHCNKDMLGIAFQIAVASGRCGRCGGIVLEDWNK